VQALNRFGLVGLSPQPPISELLAQYRLAGRALRNPSSLCNNSQITFRKRYKLLFNIVYSVLLKCMLR
jgi:hypothetical protein